MANDSTKQGYNQAAGSYVADRNQTENNPYLDRLNMLLKPKSLILDIGCGGGKPVDSYLIEKGHNVLGVDISEEMIRLAKENVPQAGYKVEDMSDLKEGEYHVDAVVSFYAIFHIPREQHADLFKKIASFLSKGGLLLVTMGANGDDPGSEGEFHGGKVFWSFYPPEKNLEIIKEAGFEIIFEEVTYTDEKQQVIFAKKS